MKVYADSSTRFSLQLLLDALFVAWVLTWIWAGTKVHDGVMALAAPGLKAESSAGSLSDSLSDAGDFLGGVPYVGDGAATPFDQASGAADSLAEAGRASVEAVESLAFWLGLGIAVVPVLLLAVIYLPGRVRWVLESTAGQRFLDGPADLELFALRAMGNQPLHVLAKVTDDPAGAWRRGDADVIARLADLELRAAGLSAPGTAAAVPTRAL
ncbi:hypothetical protein [Nocardioides dongkuii]|uniref:hypothetical protein n=1 Tax=Nocardioides dongkuii TaxID=2760089 RepID=UPI0015F824AB|nr:hypothetical protein [Nocardioides dongkuii]